ncbi:MAG TPA: choice-of-anchor D domain-containing protein, partial [Candidatus Kapabacteria bacterium]|nr:choice-of-anchor D domain-containing protein [Candidatus Kapabacteria bacterium]
GSGSHPSTGEYAQVVNDGAGNAICTWMQSSGNVYVAKYSRISGILMWGSPIRLTTNGNTNDASGLYGSPELASDGAGGAFVAWGDKDNNIYVQHVVDINMKPGAYFQLGGIEGDMIDDLALPTVNAGLARVGDIVNITEFGSIRDLGGQFPLQISRATSSQGYISLSAPSLPISINNGNSVWLSMRVSFTKAGVLNDTLIVYTNDPSACPIKIAVTGQAFTKFPMLSVQDTFQFGDHGFGYLFQRVLPVYNVGRDTLHITGAYFPPDDVTAFSVVGNPVQAIPPGGSGAIHLGFEPAGLEEDYATLVITSDDPRYADPPKTVEVSGYGVAPFVSMLAADQIDAGYVRVNHHDTVTFAITSDPNGATIPLIIKQLQFQGSLSGNFKILTPIAFPDTFAFGATQNIQIEFSPTIGKSIGAYLHCISNTSESPYDIPIFGVGEKSYLSTTSLSYGDVALNTCKTLSMHLANLGNYELNITSFDLIGVDAGRFTILDNPILMLKTGIMADIRINFCPTYSGQQNVQARIITDDGPDTIYVPITASGATPGLLETDDSIHFGVALIGHPVNKTLTIRNAGQMPVTIVGAAISGSAAIYYTDDMTMPITIGGGDSVISNFIFNPLAEGDQIASLMLTTSDGGTLVVTLSGRVTLHAYTAAPTSLFGSAIILPQVTTHEAVYITNYMDFPKIIINYRITGPDADVYGISYPLSWPLNIPAFGNDSVVATFTPTEINKTYNGTLVLYGGESDSVVITLYGTSSATDVRQPNGVPQTFSLGQNYPNPFSNVTEISYSIPVQSAVTLSIFDQLGRKVADLISGAREAGSYVVRFNAANLPSGVYYYELRTDRYVNDKIMRLVR